MVDCHKIAAQVFLRGLRSSVKFMIATDAVAGRGLDFSHVTHSC